MTADTNARDGEVHRMLTRAAQAIRESRATDALRECDAVLAGDALNVAALTIRGVASLSVADYRVAATTYNTLITLEPREPQHWTNLGTAVRALKRTDDALQAYSHAVTLGGRGASLFFNLGLAYRERGDWRNAYRWLRRALMSAPDDSEIRIECAESAFECLCDREVHTLLTDWQTFFAEQPELHVRAAALMQSIGTSVDIERLATEMLAHADVPVTMWVTLVHLCERANLLNHAESALKYAEQIAPDDRDVRAARALLYARAGQPDCAAAEWEALQQSGEPLGYLELFAHAQSLHASRRFDRVMPTLRRAHAAQRSHVDSIAPGMSCDDFQSVLDSVRAFSARHHVLTASPASEESPIFIVGFPRSGTTLLEQALDAHPQLQCMDEQPFIQQICDRWHAQTGATDVMRAQYWSMVTGKIKRASGARIIDKNPLNLLRLPVIHALFPRATIIVALRHPFDVLLSCYMQPFRAPEFARLCWDLPTLARGYARAFDSWQQDCERLQPDVILVRYEDLVRDLGATLQRVCASLRLPWHDAMLDPASHARGKAHISTPSYSQVVQPVHTRAIDQWRAYAPHFDEVRPVLQPWLTRFGYAINEREPSSPT